MKNSWTVLMLLTAIVLTGCATTSPGVVIPTDTGTVTDVYWVEVRRDTTGATLLGAIVGGYVGTRVAGGRTSQRVIAGTGGAVLGGAAGHRLATGSEWQLRVFIHLDRGGTVVVQIPHGDIAPGNRVRLIHTTPVQIQILDF